MYVTYFDEVRAIPENGQDRYWVGGLCVPMPEIAKIEAKLNDLSQDVFGTKELSEATEFHARAVYFAKFPTRKWTMTERLEILDRLFAILTEGESIKRVFASNNCKKLYRPVSMRSRTSASARRCSWGRKAPPCSSVIWTHTRTRRPSRSFHSPTRDRPVQQQTAIPCLQKLQVALWYPATNRDFDPIRSGVGIR
jgi:hypothetical protein